MNRRGIRSDHPVDGVRSLGELRDRSPTKHTGFGGPDLLPDSSQERPRRPLGLAGRQLETVDRLNDIAQRDVLLEIVPGGSRPTTRVYSRRGLHP